MTILNIIAGTSRQHPAATHTGVITKLPRSAKRKRRRRVYPLNDQLRVMIIAEVTPRIDALPTGTEVECEDLFDPEYWLSQPAKIRCAIGIYIARLVEQGEFCLQRGTDTCDRHNCYYKT